ncbi:hypothetical protein [Aneurinibacillus thermoaerophilus]|jgi:hypothetical protein|uniref:hypothetical protein n=1 Tax=Aneurinibacillus thermoaerophilus TaxID=143495 RepID=UPI002E1C8C92|nr:hypothetical protein [Aneurinibacillus thermoaerophilus]
MYATVTHPIPRTEGCEVCKARAERESKMQEKRMNEADNWYQYFLRSSIEIKHHANLRCKQRAISMIKLKGSLEDGLPISLHRKPNGDIHMVIFTSYKEGTVYRPLHICVAITAGRKCIVKTIYDPRSQPYKWNASYTKRICWCKEDNS